MAIFLKKFSCTLIILVFAQSNAKDSKFVLNIKYSTAPTLAYWIPTLRQAIEDYYKKTSEYLSYQDFTPPSTINLTIDASTDCKGSVTSNNQLYKVCTKHFPSDGPTESDLVAIVEATTWSIMNYPPPHQAPTWLTKCLATYCRWTWWFKYESTGIDKIGPSKPSYTVTSPRTASSDECAYFVNYVNTAYPKSPDVVQQINKQMRTGKYQDTDWETVTGKSARELWDEMISQG